MRALWNCNNRIRLLFKMQLESKKYVLHIFIIDTYTHDILNTSYYRRHQFQMYIKFLKKTVYAFILKIMLGRKLMDKQSNWILSRGLCLEKLIIASRASILFIFNISDSFTRFIDPGAESRENIFCSIRSRFRGGLYSKTLPRARIGPRTEGSVWYNPRQKPPR